MTDYERGQRDMAAAAVALCKDVANHGNSSRTALALADKIAALIPGEWVAVPAGTDEEKAEQAIDWIDAKADEWAASFDLPAMVKNITHPMTLSASAPPHDRQRFRDRMEQSIDAIIRQAFVEGFLRGDENRTEVLKARALIAAAQE